MSINPLVTNVNPTKSLYAALGSGGGGGGGGSTPSFSSITLQPNGDINWSGALNFQGLTGGSLSVYSTTTVGGSTPATQLQMASPDNLSELNISIDNSGVTFFSTNTGKFNFPGGTIALLNELGASNVTLSSINGAAYPPAAPPPVVTSVAVSPSQTYTYVPAGGATTTIASLTGLTNGNWYRLEGTLRLSLDANAAPTAQDNIGFTFVGNFNNFANNNTIACSFVSSCQNDVYQNFSIVAKANNANPAAFAAFTAPAPAFSTSIGVEVPLVLTDLGAF